MAYLTSQLDKIVATLEAGLAKGYATATHDGKTVTYRSIAEILEAITYFKAMYDNATDAPVPTPAKVRTFYLFGGKGIGF